MQRGIEVETGGQTYIVTTFPAFKGLMYLQKILKIVGPSVAQVFSSADLAKGELSEISIEDEALASAISSLTENLDKDNTAQLVQSMIKDSVTKSGQPVVFDQETRWRWPKLRLRLRFLTARLLQGLLTKILERRMGRRFSESSEDTSDL